MRTNMVSLPDPFELTAYLPLPCHWSLVIASSPKLLHPVLMGSVFGVIELDPPCYFIRMLFYSQGVLCCFCSSLSCLLLNMRT